MSPWPVGLYFFHLFLYSCYHVSGSLRRKFFMRCTVINRYSEKENLICCECCGQFVHDLKVVVYLLLQITFFHFHPLAKSRGLPAREVKCCNAKNICAPFFCCFVALRSLNAGFLDFHLNRQYSIIFTSPLHALYIYKCLVILDVNA